ncbi:YesL family protein [Alkalibacterium sp. s-m-22]
MEYETRPTSNLFMKGLEWVAFLAYVNLLWIGFTLIGLIVAGIGPATITVFSMIRSKLRQGDHSHIYRKFRSEYRTHFKAGNIYFGLVTSAALFLYVDSRLIQALPPNPLIQAVVIPALIILTALLLVTATFTIGYYLEYQENILISVKKGFWLSLVSPVSDLVIIHAFLFLALVLTYIPAFILFFSISLYGFITQWIMNKAFNRIKRRKKSL